MTTQDEPPAPAPPADALEAKGGAERALEAVGDAAGAAADAATGAAGNVAEDVGDAAGDATDAAGAGAEQVGEEAAGLLRDLQDISFGRILLIAVGTYALVRLIRWALPLLAERGPSQLRLYLLGAVPVARLVLLTAAVLWLLPLIFNVSVENFLVVAGAAGVAVGFAFKDLVSSLIAGVVAVFERPYGPGDWVTIEEVYGEVVSVGLRTINLRTPADDVVSIPHDTIWANPVANSNDGARTLLCTANFYLAPDHDAAAVRAALGDVGRTSAYLSYDRPVAVQLTETPWGTHYKLKAYPFDMRDQFGFVSDLTVRGKAALRALGAAEVAAPAPGPAVPT